MPANTKISSKLSPLASPQSRDSFTDTTGFSQLSKNLQFKIENDLKNCEVLWRKFAPKQSVFDLWEVRKSFYDGYKFAPYFITVYNEREIAGVLPLWFNENPTFGKTASDWKKYTWFGSNWPEDNVFFVKDENIIPLLLLAAPKPLELACIRPLSAYETLKDFPGFTSEEDKKYFLDLSHVKTLDDFLAHLKKKKRYNLKRDKKRISALSPKIIMGDKIILEEMFALSIERFRKKYPYEPSEQSAFEDERRKEVFRSLVTHAGDYHVRLITTIINDKIEAVEFGLIYKKTYYALNAGVDVSHFSGLGVFSNLLVIEDALNMGCTKIDFLESDNNWKDSWQLSSYFQYQFTK